MIIHDGAWTLFAYDPLTGRKIWRYSDDEQDVYRLDYPVTAIIEQNKALRHETGKKQRGDWRQLASIPVDLMWNSHFLQAYNAGDDRWVKRWLNNSDHRVWRTSEVYV